MKYIIALIAFMALATGMSAQTWKAMANDSQYNFYTVCDSAEAYFAKIDRFKKGSGYKGFMRWKTDNEYKYYPSGDRSQTDPLFVQRAWESYMTNNASPSKSLYQGGWKDLGPYTIDSISGHYSAGLGRVEDLFIDPSDQNKIYLGSRSGGFWSTVDGGANWNGGSTDFLPASGVNALSASPSNSDSVLINVQNAQNQYSHGVYRSVNGGQSWTPTNFNPQNLGFGGLGSNFQVYEIEYHPRVADLVFIGTNRGLFRSTDNLQTWTLYLSNSDITEIAFHPTNDNIVYVYDNYYWGSNQNYVLISSDQGVNFTTSSAVPNNNGDRNVRLSVSNDCPNCLFFASSNGVWKSTDNGQTFSFLSLPNSSLGGFVVNDININHMIYGYLDMFRSTDGGQSFSQNAAWSLGSTNGAGNGHHLSYLTSTNYVHADLRNAKSVNGVYYVATDGFLCRSTDNGVTWSILSEGTGIRENYSLGASQSNHYRNVSGSQDNGTSILREFGWLEFYGADGMECLVHPLNDDWMMGSVQYGNRRLTKDGGISQSGATPANTNNAYWIAPLAYDPNDHMIIYDFRESVHRSNDFTNTFTTLGDPSFSGDIMSAEIAQNNSNIMVVTRNENIEKSTDGGQTFTSIRGTLPNASIQDVAFDPNDDDVIVVVYGTYQNNGEKVFITQDGGLSWTNITGNLGDMPIRSVVIDHTNFSNIYLGAEIGVYTKSMSGSTWTLYNPQLPNVSVRELEVVYGSNTIRAATWGRGLWEYSLVNREDFPAIVHTSISNNPTETTPKETVEQYVTSRIHYTGTLTDVYVEWSANAPTFGNVIPMSHLYDSTWRTVQPLPDFPAGTKIYFKVFAEGGNNDLTETYKFMYEVQPYEYCDAIGTDDNGNLFLSNVSFETINNNTNNDHYTLYNNPVVDIFRNNTYSMNLSANTGWGENDYSVWIDYNNDAHFSNEEKVIDAPNSGGSATASFTVPQIINVGDTVRMRIRLSYFGTGTPCGSALGEVEDYLVALRSSGNDNIILSTNQLCLDESLNIQYDNSNVDSVKWLFTNGATSVQSDQFIDVINFTQTGTYDMHLTIFDNGQTSQIDSIGALEVGQTTFGTDLVSACVEYTWMDGQTYTASNNTAQHVIANSQGCDSIITLDLTINSVDITVNENGIELTSNANNATYQWLECQNGNYSAISGATNQSYTATSNGEYSVQVTQNGCTDTSACYSISSVALDELSDVFGIQLFPNPSNGQFKLDLKQMNQNALVSIYSIDGKLLSSKQTQGEQKIEFDLNIAPGKYLISIQLDDQILVSEFVVE